VQLSKHDLAQLDDAALAALTPEQLHALSVKLLADLKLAHERLDRNPRNSSRPPSRTTPRRTRPWADATSAHRSPRRASPHALRALCAGPPRHRPARA
jgi:hypothetical protein